VETRGKGDNYLKNEALVHDDGHKYFRQHGQRVKRTKDGGQQLYLDNRLAEVNDVIGLNIPSVAFIFALLNFFHKKNYSK